MQTITEIEDAIGRLSEDEMFMLVERLESKMADTWDRQIEGDVRSGRLNKIAQLALAEHRAGRSSPFPSDAK
jgi:hypothetical protein